MAKMAKKSARGRKQDRALVAGGQDYEVREGPQICFGSEEGRQESR